MIIKKGHRGLAVAGLSEEIEAFSRSGILISKKQTPLTTPAVEVL